MADMKNLIGQLKAAEAQSRVDYIKRQSNIHYNETRTRILEDCPSAVDALRLAALMPSVKVVSHKSKTQIRGGPTCGHVWEIGHGASIIITVTKDPPTRGISARRISKTLRIG